MRGVDSEICGRTEDIHGNHTGYFYIDPEISLRDLFAAFALGNFVEEGLKADVAAKEAYEYADAMLKAREAATAKAATGGGQ